MNTALSRKVFFSRNEHPAKNGWSHGRNIHPYMKAAFWANPANHFWESDTHTEAAKEYFRAQIQALVSDRHNAVRIENAQIATI